MNTPAHSADDILAALDDVGPPGAPVTKADIAAEFGDTDQWLEDGLERLVADGRLRSRSVGSDGRVWWRPPDTEGGQQADLDAFRVSLNDTLRSLSDPVEIQEEAARVLAERLNTDRAVYAEVFPDGETVEAKSWFQRPGLAALGVKHQFSDFSEDVAATLRRGEPVVVDDVTAIEDQSDAQEKAYLSADIHAYLTVPRLKDGRLVGLFTLHQNSPRAWGEMALSLTEETVERTWEAVERARAEQTLEETNAELERLNAATRELITADVATLRATVAGLAREVLGCASTTLWCYDSDVGELRAVATATAPGRTAEAARPPERLGETVWETFVSGDRTVENDIGSPDGVPDGPSVEPVRSRVLVPLGHHGVLGVASTRPYRFDRGMLDLVETLASTVESSWDRADGEAELQRQNRELTRLDELNTLIRRIDQALVEADTVAAIDETVCDRLAASAPYEFAWVGSYDGETDTVEPRAWAGVDSAAMESLAGPTVTTGAERSRGRANEAGPFLTAIESGEMQTVADIATDPRATPWRQAALERGGRSCHCIPLVYEESVYGLLVVYGGTPHDEDRDAEVLSELGGTIAHAIHAAETSVTRQRDSVVELTLRTTVADTPLCRLARKTGCTIELDGQVLGSSTEPVVVFTAEGMASAELVAVAEASLAFADVTVLNESDAGTLYQATLTDEPLATRLQGRSATVGTLTIDSGVATAVVALPETAAVREYVDGLTDAVPNVELVGRHTRERSTGTTRQLRTTFRDQLTPRQQEVLSMAYRCGFFETPRVQTGAELAEAVGVAQSTFNYHLRGAQRTLFEAVFDRE